MAQEILAQSKKDEYLSDTRKTKRNEILRRRRLSTYEAVSQQYNQSMMETQPEDPNLPFDQDAEEPVPLHDEPLDEDTGEGQNWPFLEKSWFSDRVGELFLVDHGWSVKRDGGKLNVLSPDIEVEHPQHRRMLFQQAVSQTADAGASKITTTPTTSTSLPPPASIIPPAGTICGVQYFGRVDKLTSNDTYATLSPSSTADIVRLWPGDKMVFETPITLLTGTGDLSTTQIPLRGSTIAPVPTAGVIAPAVIQVPLQYRDPAVSDLSDLMTMVATTANSGQPTEPSTLLQQLRINCKWSRGAKNAVACEIRGLEATLALGKHSFVFSTDPEHVKRQFTPEKE